MKPPNYLIDIRRRVLVQLLIVAEDDNRDIDGAENGELVSLLEQATFALEEGDATVAIVSNCVRAMQWLAWERLHGERCSDGVVGEQWEWETLTRLNLDLAPAHGEGNLSDRS